EAPAACAAAASSLTGALEKATDPRHLRPLVQALVRLAPRLDRAAVEQAGLRLARRLGRSTRSEQVAALGGALAELTQQTRVGELVPPLPGRGAAGPRRGRASPGAEGLGRPAGDLDGADVLPG